ncbi:glycosyltransferase family 4 protein [soil metagenome]
MKVLIVNSSDLEGGAARAAHRLYTGLRSSGIDAEMLVLQKKSNDSNIIGPQGKLSKAFSFLRPSLDKIPLKKYPERTKTPFSPAWVPFSGIAKIINNSDVDIVHLHWINAGMIRIEEIAKIKKPIVWSLHDMWAFTGGCHYDEECGKYKSKCGKCPVLNSSIENDLSRKVFLRKKKAYKDLNITLVGLSNWLANCAINSSLFDRSQVVNIPNPIDTELFKPINKDFSREALRLPNMKKLVLFGAMNATSDPRKGFKELTGALQKAKSDDIELMILGADKPKDDIKYNFPVHYLGRKYDDLSLKIIYSAADVMVLPSIQENLSNAIMESMSCGTPVTAFDIGGNSDLIDDKVNGYLAKAYSIKDLSDGILWCLKGEKNSLELSKQARGKVISSFEQSIISKKYVSLYKKILNLG